MNNARLADGLLAYGERIRLETGHIDLVHRDGRSDFKLSKRHRRELAARLAQREQSFVRNGVNFSRLNGVPLLRHAAAGRRIEIEALGPYLASYHALGGRITRERLIAEDAIGLRLTVMLRALFPDSRLISLYDDYNTSLPGEEPAALSFSPYESEVFKESLTSLYKEAGALSTTAVEGVDYFLLAESSMIKAAEELVARLEAKRKIERKDEEIVFVSKSAENPLHRRIMLRTGKGKWLCEALDAATFLKEENLNITHIVALPDYMKSQQDKVWELLRVLGMHPYHYHNIFYSCDYSPEVIAQTVADEFASYTDELDIEYEIAVGRDIYSSAN